MEDWKIREALDIIDWNEQTTMEYYLNQMQDEIDYLEGKLIIHREW